MRHHKNNIGINRDIKKNSFLAHGRHSILFYMHVEIFKHISHSVARGDKQEIAGNRFAKKNLLIIGISF